MGTSKIHLCTGTRDRDNMWRRHPENDSPAAWRDMAACVREATDIARQAGVRKLVLTHLAPPVPTALPDVAMRLLFLGKISADFEGTLVFGKDRLWVHLRQ